MIPPNLGNLDILRRVLLDLDNRTIDVEVPISTADKLAADADLATTVKKVNELIDILNAVASTLNSARNNNF